MIVALEGLPGVGKTTAAGHVASRLGIKALRETTADHPFLAQVYNDQNRDDLSVELSFLLVHANPFRLLDRTQVTIADFSPVKDLLFAEQMLSSGDLQLFRGVYEHIYRGFRRPELVVYLNADPRLCLERVRHRMTLDPSRAFEAGMTLERLEQMRGRYEAGLSRLGGATQVVDVTPLARPDDVATAIIDVLPSLVADREERGGR